MRAEICASLLALAAFASAAPAWADVDEIRLGVVEHNIRWKDGEYAPKEDGPNIEGELVWSSPHWLELIGSPRPYAMVSYNTHGNTSFAGVGAYWRWEFADGWAFEPGFGYVLHNGENDIPFADGTPEAAEFDARHQLLGSRDLFRTTLALEREFGNHFAAQLYYEHLSHGQILDKGRNQGLDEAGLRLIFRLNPDPAD
jgi:lipid A 3-O-deacylase